MILCCGCQLLHSHRAANERAGSLAAQLAARAEEVSSLQARLKRKDAELGAIEGEIQRQVRVSGDIL